MSKFKINVNEKNKLVDVVPSTPLLWVLRDKLNLTGTKFGCGSEKEIVVFYADILVFYSFRGFVTY